MEPKTRKKEFDTVKFSRTEKQRISGETAGMSYEELKVYLKNRQTLTKEK